MSDKKNDDDFKAVGKKSTASKPKRKGTKIGTIPPGFDQNDVLFMEDNKIFIVKK